MKCPRVAGYAAVALALAGAGLAVTASAADEPHKAQIEALRKSLEKYQDYKVAVRDLYLSTVGYVHYDLHAWLFKNNPLGMFAPTNPDVSCKDSDFALLEGPTKMMPGP